MSSKLLWPLALFALTLHAQPPLKFQGQRVSITEPKLDESGANPQSPGAICVEWEQRQCYTTPQGYGRAPEAHPVQVAEDLEALLFSAATGGVSDFGIHFALLTRGAGRELQDLFYSTIEASNQSRHALWNEPSISSSQIFVLADYVWDPAESSHGPHRYMISAYVRKPAPAFDVAHYYLEDRYMTARKYDPAAKTDILASEKQEILARLMRLK
jgi:hypothetical protein